MNDENCNAPARPTCETEDSGQSVSTGLTKHEDFVKAIIAGLVANPHHFKTKVSFIVARAKELATSALKE